MEAGTQMKGHVDSTLKETAEDIRCEDHPQQETATAPGELPADKKALADELIKQYRLEELCR